MELRFEWSEAKVKSNFEKHWVWFSEAQTVWADAHSVEFFYPDHSDREDRFIRLGRSSGGRLLLVVFCERRDTVRIIGARRATFKERYRYEEGI